MLQRLFLVCTLFFFSLYSPAQILQWAKKVNGSGSDQGGYSVVDKFGNLYVTGSFEGNNVDFDPGPGNFLMSSAGLKDGFVAKYDANGNFVWGFKIGGSSHDEVTDITLDSAGNIVITGYFRRTSVDFDPSANNAFLSSNGESGGDPGYGGDIFIAKYDTSSNYKWAFNIGGNDIGDNGLSVSCDKNNDILLTGYFRSIVDFDPSGNTASLNQSNGTLFIAKYSSAGQYRWAFNTGQGGIVDNTGFKIIADNANNVIVTGFFQGTNIDFDPSTGVNNLSSNGFFDYFVAKYSANGQFLWAKSAGGSGADVGRSVTIDAADNIYVTGDYSSSSINFNNGNGANNLINKGSNDLFLVKYSPSGTHLWSFGTGGSGSELGMDIGTDNEGNVIITGTFTGINVDFDPSPNVTSLSSNSGNDIYAVKYTSAGNYLCSFSVGGSGNDIGRGITNFGNYSYITGSFNGSNVDFDPRSSSTLLSSTGDDVCLTKYDWTITPPAGTFTASSNCVTGHIFFTFTATSGTGPFSLHINNGSMTTVYNNIQSGVPFQLTSSPSASGTYTLVGIKDANLCSALTPANLIVTVTSIPITTSGNTSICKFDSVQLNASGGTTYQWIPSIGLSDPSIPNPKASPLVTTTYKLIVSNGAGCKDSTTLTVAIKPSPNISILPNNASFCNGDSVQLIASGGINYQWSPASGLSNPSIANPKASPSTTTTYKLVVVDSEGCKDSTTKTVTKSSGPTVTVLTVAPICAGDSTQLSAAGGSSYQWFPSTGLNNSVIANPKASPGTTTTYKVVVTNAEGCKDSATTLVSIKPGPSITITPSGSICKGDSIQLNASGGINYQWYPSSSLLNAATPNPKAFPITTTTYTVIATAANGCIDSAKTTVTVNQPPGITLTANSAICFGDSVQLNANGGVQYQWLPATGLNDPTIASPKASPLVTTTYRVLVHSSDHCADSAFVTVSVKPKPNVTVSAPFSICAGDTAQLSASGGISYQWFPSLGLSNSLIADPNTFPGVTTTYMVVVTNSDACKDSAQTTVTVTPKPKPNLGSDTSICLSENLVLNATTTSGITYDWNTGATTPTITVTQPGLYIVTVGINGCNSPSIDSINVENLPVPTVSIGNDTTICNFYTLPVKAAGENIERYLWSTGSTDSAIYVSQSGVYSVSVSNKCGEASDDVLISVDICSEDLFFPSAFTPNKDQRNDLFKAGYFQGFPVHDYQLQIFNRWGERVYSTNNVAQGWDGRINGKDQPTGVFVWIAQYRKAANGPLIRKKGTMVLIR